jgi:hypothetical protein
MAELEDLRSENSRLIAEMGNNQTTFEVVILEGSRLSFLLPPDTSKGS